MEISNVTNDNEMQVMKDEELEETIDKLHKLKDPVLNRYHYFHEGFWVPESAIRGVISFQKHFVAQDDDLVLASCPKSGTTWLKALAFAIVHRARFSPTNSPLLVANPHDLVPLNMGHNIETNVQTKSTDHVPDNIMKPRLFSTHVPYSSLPTSIKESSCKIVYICRNPLDLFVSLWHFSPKVYGEDVEPNGLEESFDRFCRGIHAFGPFWDHILGFWNAGLESPQKILFLKYEDLKKDNVLWIKRLADFLGYAFSREEEDQGVVEEISKLCSIEKMKSLEVNKNGRRPVIGLQHKAFFRKGEVGDWANYLSSEMADRGKNLIEEKFSESSLSFEFTLSK